jgi:hypothetical protein
MNLRWRVPLTSQVVQPASLSCSCSYVGRDTGLQCECGDQRLRRLADNLLSNGIQNDFGRIVQIEFLHQVHPVCLHCIGAYL